MSDQSSLHSFLSAHENPLAIQESAFATSRGVKFIQRWIWEERKFNPTIDDQRDRNAYKMEWLDEIYGAVDGIDDPSGRVCELVDLVGRRRFLFSDEAKK